MADEDAKQVPAEGEHPTTRQRQRAGPLIALLHALTHVFCHTLLPLIAPRTDLHHRGDRLFSISSEEEQQAKLEAQRRSKGKQPAEEEEDDDDEVVRRQRGSRSRSWRRLPLREAVPQRHELALPACRSLTKMRTQTTTLTMWTLTRRVSAMALGCVLARSMGARL